jgi:hypothetical protein
MNDSPIICNNDLYNHANQDKLVNGVTDVIY